MESVRAFTIGDEAFFPGVVALVNSLRLTGNSMPLTVLDLGLTADQRRLLEPHCELDAAPRNPYPYLQKPELLQRSTAGVVVFLDADVIVTGSLDDVVRDAGEGRFVASLDVAAERWFAAWSDLFALRAPLRRERHVSAGFVALAPERLPTLLPRWSELCRSLHGRRLALDAGGPDDPIWLGDQDALNALLMSEVPAERVARTTDMAFDEFERVEVDVETLRCRRGGEPVRVLHAIGHPKPWQPRARWAWRSGPYTRCLSRVLAGPDLAVRIPRAMVAPWLRTGPAAAASRAWMGAYDRAASRTRPWRVRVGLSPLRRRDGSIPGREG